MTAASTLFRAATACIALAAVTSPALSQERLEWNGRSNDRAHGLIGPGVPLLYPELRRSPRGREFVMSDFDVNDDGVVSRREAHAANRTFADARGPGRDGFAWNERDRHVSTPAEGDGWDRREMRDYGFRQTPRGATLTLQEDVLFRTDSAELRPGAMDKLRPLAAYLRSEPGVRVAITGHTDARGTDAHNQDLSDRRADSVRAAFDDMGVTRARFLVGGRGESEPVATNATAAGMRLNRRVEVTLLGQRAERFSSRD